MGLGAAILVAGLALRLYRLGALGLAWDEEFRAPSLASVDDLRHALERHRGARVWIVLEAVHLRRVEHDPRMADILRLIARRAGKPRYRGSDGLSDVYLVEPHAPGHQSSPIPHGEPAADHELNPGRAARAGAP